MRRARTKREAKQKTSLAHQMMEMLDDNTDHMKEKLYIDLANLVGSISKMERRSKRMRKKLLSYDGSSCSALVPSDDGAGNIEPEESDEDMDLDDDEEDQGGGGGDQNSDAASDVSSNATIDEIVDDATEARDLLPLSRYLLKYRGELYHVPQSAILRDHAVAQQFHMERNRQRAVTRGGRTQFWSNRASAATGQNQGAFNPAAVVVLKVKARDGRERRSWYLRVRSPDDDDHTVSSRILHPIPARSIYAMLTWLERHDRLGTSCLLTDRKATGLYFYNPHGGPRKPMAPAIPGRSRRYNPANDDEGFALTEAGDVAVGNYWPKVDVI